jgi:hypothetical protein
MEELEKGLEELRGFAALWREQQCQQARSPKLPGTGPPIKEYTWRDPWRWLHMWQRMALLDISGRRCPWSFEGSMPQCRGTPEGKDLREVTVGGWVGEHPHRSRQMG